MKKIDYLILFIVNIFWLACHHEKLDTETGTVITIANFAIEHGNCNAPCLVGFTNLSTNADVFEWDFGDGSPKAFTINPTHLYTMPGNYVVSLRVTGSGGTDIQTQTVTVNSLTFVRYFGTPRTDQGFDVRQCTDGGYLMAGVTYTENMNDMDMYIVKTDETGSMTWSNSFGSIIEEACLSSQQTSDGGYILFGYQYNNFCLIKTDISGDQEWLKTYNNMGSETGYSVQQTTDGGYILLGVTLPLGAVYSNILMIKTDDSGTLQWQQTFEGAWGFSVQQTGDGGYIIAGDTRKSGAGSKDVYLIKTDELGNKLWEKTFGGSELDSGKSVVQTPDGGYILLGYTESQGAGYQDAYLIKTDIAGNLEWEKTFGGIYNDGGACVQPISDGCYVLVGYTYNESSGDTDAFLIKTDGTGILLWKRIFGGPYNDYALAVRQTTDGGFILTGRAQNPDSVSEDIYLIKTDKNGNVH